MFFRRLQKKPDNYSDFVSATGHQVELFGLAPAEVRIICYEDTDAWILGKFAVRMNSILQAIFGIKSSIAKFGKGTASVGHHIIYFDAKDKWSDVESFMITHLDMEFKFELVEKQLQMYDMGICMSEFTRDLLIDRGMPATKLTYVNPAHDLLMKPRKLKLGIASKTHPDGRKLENLFVEKINSNDLSKNFEICIMGAGWEKQVKVLRESGWKVTYDNKFNNKKYLNSFFPQLDYFLHWTHDEGSMAFIDAIAADVKTIITPQGYHLDINGGIDHSIQGLDDMISVLKKIQIERSNRISRVSSWTWEEYSKRHLFIWSYLLGRSDSEISDFCKQNKEVFEVIDGKTELKYVPSLMEIAGLKKLASSNEKLITWLNCLEIVFYPKSENAAFELEKAL